MKFEQKMDESVISYSNGVITENYIARDEHGHQHQHSREMKLNQLQQERVEHVIDMLADKPTAAARFLFFCMKGWANIAPYYNFTYVVEAKMYSDNTYAFENPADAEAYVSQHDNAEIVYAPTKYDGYVYIIGLDAKPHDDGRIWVDVRYED